MWTDSCGDWTTEPCASAHPFVCEHDGSLADPGAYCPCRQVSPRTSDEPASLGEQCVAMHRCDTTVSLVLADEMNGADVPDGWRGMNLEQ